jgi:hypothetical protein
VQNYVEGKYFTQSQPIAFDDIPSNNGVASEAQSYVSGNFAPGKPQKIKLTPYRVPRVFDPRAVPLYPDLVPEEEVPAAPPEEAPPAEQGPAEEPTPTETPVPLIELTITPEAEPTELPPTETPTPEPEPTAVPSEAPSATPLPPTATTVPDTPTPEPPEDTPTAESTTEP